MNKKILSFILAICLLIPFTFTLSACFDDGSDFYAISADEWQSVFSSDSFSCWATTKYTTIDYYYLDGEIQVDVLSGADKGNYYYVKNDDGGLTSYKNTVKTEEGWADLTDMTATDYNGMCEPAINFLVYLKNSYNEFTFDGCRYELSQSEVDSVKNRVSQIISMFNLERDELRFDLQSVYVSRSITWRGSQRNKEYSVGLRDDNDDIRLSMTISEIGYKISRYKYDCAFANLNNYSVQMVEETSISHYDIVEDGIRISLTSYQPVSINEVFYYHDLQNDDYYYYYKNTDGDFVKIKLLSGSNYETALEVLYLEVFPFADNYGWFFGSQTCVKGGGSYTRGSTTYYFKDVVLNFDEDGNIIGGTWKAYFTIGEVTSLVSDVTLTTGNTTITYPPIVE